MLTIVIGDIHGMAAKLENLLGQIDMWCAANAMAELRQLIFLGDYIDRGPDSRQVLQIVQRLQAEGATTRPQLQNPPGSQRRTPRMHSASRRIRALRKTQ